MSVRREVRRRQDGRERVIVHRRHQAPAPQRGGRAGPKGLAGRQPAGARAYERELREALLREDREPPGVAAEVSTSSRFADAVDLVDEEVSDNDNDYPAPDCALRVRASQPVTDARTRGRPAPASPAATRSAGPAAEDPDLRRVRPGLHALPGEPRGLAAGREQSPASSARSSGSSTTTCSPAFGALRLDQISARLVDTYVAVKAAPGGGASRTRAKATTTAANRRASARSKALAPSTIANHLILLRRALSVAHRWELIERVPAIQSPIPAEQRFDFLTFEEAERFLATRPEWRALFLLALRTGMRLGELRALRWRDVDLEARPPPGRAQP